ncbi:hypothetical protein LINPERPRIM_LOCUS8570, partial [Linum perenne]
MEWKASERNNYSSAYYTIPYLLWYNDCFTLFTYISKIMVFICTNYDVIILIMVLYIIFCFYFINIL